MPSFAAFIAFLCRATALSLLLTPLLSPLTALADGAPVENAEASAVLKLKASIGLRDESDADVTAGRAAAETTGAAPGALRGVSGSGPHRVVFSMLADVSSRTSLVFERSRLAPTVESARAAIIGNAPQTRVGVEFRPVSAGSALKPIGALRVQMSDNASLSFKPRRGGLLVSWRSQF